MLMLPDFNRLKVFYYIYANQSIVAAAKELNITQSAISQHLKKLEYEMKTPLFTRLHKRLVPTAEAERLFNILQPFFHELETGLRSIKQAKVKPSGILRIGAPTEFGKAYFPGIFASFREQYPDVIFSLKLGDPSILLSKVSEGQLDFALVDVFLAQNRFFTDLGIYSIEPIFEEEVILACSDKYCETVLHHDFSFDNLISREYISFVQNAVALKSWFRHHFGKSSVKPNVVMTVDSVQAAISGIRHHMGMGIIVSHLVYDDIKSGTIIPITTDKKDIINRISLVQLQDKIPSLTDKTFQAHFKSEMRSRSGIEKVSGNL
jgi:DNA-binding transcriptional LysR family regulator